VPRGAGYHGLNAYTYRGGDVRAIIDSWFVLTRPVTPATNWKDFWQRCSKFFQHRNHNESAHAEAHRNQYLKASHLRWPLDCERRDSAASGIPVLPIAEIQRAVVKRA